MDVWIICRKFDNVKLIQMHYRSCLLFSLLLFFLQSAAGQGKLFIIGGGARPPVLLHRLIDEGGVRNGGYILVLPMASEEQDSAIWYARRQFFNEGLTQVAGVSIKEGHMPGRAVLDSIENAAVIYITGGDQVRFMNVIKGTGIGESLHNAYRRGALIAGTSAGAAVMSRMMITGNEKRYPNYAQTFRAVESDNVELTEGLGFLQSVIIDQHFIKRSRYNRLITLAIEHPQYTGIGIDEATAILVRGKTAEVVGISQVVVIRNTKKAASVKGNKLGGRGLTMDILLPGEKFEIPQGKR